MIWAVLMILGGLVCLFGGIYRFAEALRTKRVWRSYEYFDRATKPVDYWLATITRPIGILLGLLLTAGGILLLVGTHT